MRTAPTAWLAALLLAFHLAPSAQVAFDAASVKESKSLSDGGTLRLMPGGGITAEHVPARGYITTAYELQPFQLVGAPAWTLDTYYDIVAKPGGAATHEQTLAMLQALLKERFKLTVHREKRQLDGFALVRVRPGQLGPGLRPSTLNCERDLATEPKCRQGGINFQASVTTMKVTGSSIQRIVRTAVGAMAAPVSDDTSLTGTFDIDLRWSSEVAPADDLQTFATALQDQLGLKLERRRVEQEIFVIDHIERPSPD